MAWLSLWAPLLLQLALPIALLAGLARTTCSRLAFVTGSIFVAAYVVALAVAGLWLVLPWYTPAMLGMTWLGIVAGSWPRFAMARSWPAGWLGWLLTAASVSGTVALAGLIAVAWSAGRSPAATVDLDMPVRSGTYLVVNGGGHTLVNPHLGTLDVKRAAPYRGQSYAVDLVRVDGFGMRARGLLPADPAAYVIFGDPVVAPCAGHVVASTDGLLDLSPPRADRVHLAGNHVILACDRAWVVLAHLRNGSVAVRPGDRVAVGQYLGDVGNSGNTSEPHLHVHAQRPGSDDAPLGGEPLHIRLAGRFVVRNDRVTGGSARAARP